jgi:hypothetical protein
VNLIDNIKNILISSALCLVIGFCSGYYTKGKFFKAEQVDAQVEARHETASNIVESHNADVAIEAKVGADSANVSVIRAIVDRHIKEKLDDSKTNSSKDCKPFTLDAFTVGLLNDARSGSAVSAAGVSDETLSAASSVTVSSSRH